MTEKYEIDGLQCLCSQVERKDRVAYVLYPMDMLTGWIEDASKKFDTNIVVITGMDWQNVFSPWPAPGVPKGTEDFKGESPEFLKLLQERVLPQIEGKMGLKNNVVRSLVGVSMSGLFALWQWMVCDTFTNIASLSGSFWYEGFLKWMENLKIPTKSGMGFFLLGEDEPKSKVKVFATVGERTAAILNLLKDAGVSVKFLSVPGNHYSDAIPRLNAAFAALY